jgi:hypothetical protein
MPTETHEEPATTMSPEQQPVAQPSEIVPQEQIQEIPPVQTQENIQLQQQQQGLG